MSNEASPSKNAYPGTGDRGLGASTAEPMWMPEASSYISRGGLVVANHAPADDASTATTVRIAGECRRQ